MNINRKLPDLLPDPYTARSTLFLACRACALPKEARQDVCLHDVSLDALLELRATPCLAIVATRGDCLNCADSPYPNGEHPRPRLEEQLEQINEKLRLRDMSGLMVHWLDEYSWQAQKDAAIALKVQQTTSTSPPTSPLENRRRFFRQWLPSLLD